MDETQVQETVETQQEPDLSGVEIVSNGEPISLEPSKDEPKTEEPSEEDKQQKEEPKESPSEQKELEEAKGEQEEAKKELSSKNVDYDALEKEYLEKGELSAESYKQLEEAGYPKSLVKAVIAGWQSKADAFTNKVIEDAGGKREFQRVQKFVQEQGSAAINAFNEIMEKSDLNLVTNYILGLKAQMVAKYGTTNPTLGGQGATTTVKGYESPADMVKAMSDPRYNTDAKYRQEVEDKVAKSTFF